MTASGTAAPAPGKPWSRAIGVRDLGAGLFQATGDDPRFVFRATSAGARYLLVLVAGFGDPMDPVIYWDRGRGFKPDGSIELSACRAAFIVTDLSDRPDLRRLRFDPAAAPERFLFDAAFCADAAALEAAAARLAAGRSLPPGVDRAVLVVGSDQRFPALQACLDAMPEAAPATRPAAPAWRVSWPILAYDRNETRRFIRPFGPARYLFLQVPAGARLALRHGRRPFKRSLAPLGPGGDALVALALESMPDLKAIEVTGPDARRVTVSATRSTELLARELDRVTQTGGQIALLGRPEDFAGLPGSEGAKSVLARSPAAHFAKIVALGKAAESRAPLAIDPGKPLISLLVPTFNTPIRYLETLVASFHAQPPGLAELILADDGSTDPQTRAFIGAVVDRAGILATASDANAGIAAATNRALAMARGAWVGLLDHDDALAEGSLSRVAETLTARPDCAFLYTDEAIVDDAMVVRDYILKPAYDPVLLSGVNYINHLSLYRRERLLALCGLRAGFEGSQDYDLVLRYLDGVDPARVVHLPYPAYLWRRTGATYSATHLLGATRAARRALAERYRAPVGPAIRPDLHRVGLDDPRPRVSVVIPNRDSPDLIARVIEGLTTGTDYPDIELLVVDNGSTDRRTLELYEGWRARLPGFQALVRPEPFNFARQTNRGVAAATGDYVLMLNNDVEIIDRGWLAEMVACFGYGDVGIVGAKLLYPDRTIQHAGVIVGLGGYAGHWFLGAPEDEPGPFGRLAVRGTLSSVTGACMLVSRACLDRIGGLDEEAFAIAYNDIDLCLRAAEAGYRTVFTPFATLIHHESASRGSDQTPWNRPRFRREQANLAARHGTATFEDRYFSPWWTRDRSHPVLAERDSLPKAR